jgi:hypothetical protein
VDAQRCYSQAYGLLDKDHDSYKEVDERSKILDELLPFASAVELQDSLQMMARLDSVTRMEKIKKTIEELKKKEKEEEKKAAEANNVQSNRGNQNQQQGGATARQNAANRNAQQTAVWYFYNPPAVAAGKSEFERKWGKRELTDDWRRNNKTVLNDFNEEELSDSLKAAQDSIAAVEDSIYQANKGKKQTRAEKDSIKQEEYANDPHRPEYYLKDIPFTEEQMAASNAALVEGLYGSAIIYKDRMDNFPLAERTFQRILLNFPELLVLVSERKQFRTYNIDVLRF